MPNFKDLPGVRTVYRSRYAVPVHAFVLDRWNRARYGPSAPRFAERLWIDPRDVRTFGLHGTIWRSGRVRDDWPEGARPLDEDPVLTCAIARWRDGLPWEQTGEFEMMDRTIARLGHHDGVRTREDVIRRCAQLDEVFREIEREGRVRPRNEVVPNAFRELGGIGVHIGPDGELVRGINGRHRFAMAWILGIERIPVRIGMVHRSAIPHLDRMRRP
ncbi:MAG TPA: hypothetical protein VHR55_06490 [Candidatus Limnocylindria bacterium]|nr:hypothetical protein [Candidatus Limnocylindria bacterium]